MKSKRGITLVSLVVTIIVLIILATISINLILGENGIITIAKQAKENMEIAKIEEETSLNELYTQIVSEGEVSGSTSNDATVQLLGFKKVIADAITEMGVTTSESASAETMATNIKSIKNGSNLLGIIYSSNKGGTQTQQKYTVNNSGKMRVYYTHWLNGQAYGTITLYGYDTISEEVVISDMPNGYSYQRFAYVDITASAGAEIYLNCPSSTLCATGIIVSE